MGPGTAVAGDERIEAIRHTVAEAQAHQGDVEGFMALHTTEAIIVNLAGRRVLGSDAIRVALSQALATPLAQVITTAEVDDIRFVRPDVAIVSCTKHVHDRRNAAANDGQAAPLPTRARLTYVMVEEADRWRIASAQTTPTVETTENAVTYPTHTPADARRDDIAALIARVAELADAQRTEDVDAFLRLFDDDAVWVTGGGKRLIGLSAIAEFTRAVLPGAMADGSVSYDVEHIAMVTPDIALTGVRQTYLDLDGTPTGRGLPSYVWARGSEGDWRIVVGQNTGVPEAP
jgi:uncharacterized protein (TIGR02246 family)